MQICQVRQRHDEYSSAHSQPEASRSPSKPTIHHIRSSAHFRAYIAEGLSGRAAAARLKVSAATGVRWKRKLRDTGSIRPEVQGLPVARGKPAAHQAFLEELVAQDGDITLPELAGALEAATGVVAHSASVGRFLRKLGYTYKKSHWSRPSACAHV